MWRRLVIAVAAVHGARVNNGGASALSPAQWQQVANDPYCWWPASKKQLAIQTRAGVWSLTHWVSA
ncbi:hypothetical protein AN401_11040 [Zobellella denitrificans]|uniref:Uncharacterized protein n=1 Tax=Zobellella denitrificans TaxID=347534 RepID=A0A291HQE0_9GAMM|nr:hypothetical protein [Zobellella denitrificans]ATG74329.1 hypothetical protein AN401_11040 [Zobellella denitrificans]